MNLDETDKRKPTYICNFEDEEYSKFRDEFTQEFTLFTQSLHQKTIKKVNI